MKSLTLVIPLICALASATTGATSSTDVVVQVDNEKVVLNGSEIGSMDVLRTVVANVQRETVVAVEAHVCTKWRKVEEVLEIVRERSDLLIVKFSTFGDSDDPVCTRSRGAA